jgi:hypothetical protein
MIKKHFQVVTAILEFSASTSSECIYLTSTLILNSIFFFLRHSIAHNECHKRTSSIPRCSQRRLNRRRLSRRQNRRPLSMVTNNNQTQNSFNTFRCSIYNNLISFLKARRSWCWRSERVCRETGSTYQFSDSKMRNKIEA